MKTKNFLFLICIAISPAMAQINKDELALKVSKAEEDNSQKLKEYIWKRKSDVFVEKQLKITVITEFSFSADGKLEAKVVDAESSVKKKRGLRGRAQKNAIEDKMEYVEKALDLSLHYTFMSKGELIDFMSKATVTEKGGIIEAVANNLFVEGDRLLVKIDPHTYLYTYKEFSSLLGKDKVDGKMNYEKFSTGPNHGSTTSLNLPAQKMTIEAKNQDYTVRVK